MGNIKKNIRNIVLNLKLFYCMICRYGSQQSTEISHWKVLEYFSDTNYYYLYKTLRLHNITFYNFATIK